MLSVTNMDLLVFVKALGTYSFFSGGTEGEVFGLATIIRLKGSEVSDMVVRHMSKSVATTDRRGQLSNLLTALGKYFSSIFLRI